jgi:hypothetical protein
MTEVAAEDERPISRGAECKTRVCVTMLMYGLIGFGGV